MKTITEYREVLKQLGEDLGRIKQNIIHENRDPNKDERQSMKDIMDKLQKPKISSKLWKMRRKRLMTLMSPSREKYLQQIRGILAEVIVNQCRKIVTVLQRSGSSSLR